MHTYYLYFHIGTRKSLGFKNNSLLDDNEVRDTAGITEESSCIVAVMSWKHFHLYPNPIFVVNFREHKNTDSCIPLAGTVMTSSQIIQPLENAILHSWESKKWKRQITL